MTLRGWAIAGGRTARAASDVVSVLGIATCLVLVFLQFVDLEGNLWVVAIEPFTPYALAPLAIIVAITLRRHQRRLAPAAVITLGAVLVLVAPAVIGGRSATAPPTSAPRFTLLTENVDGPDNKTIELSGRSVRDSGADVVVMQEVSPAILSEFKAAGDLAVYPYSFFANGLVVYTKSPMLDPLSVGTAKSTIAKVGLSIGGQQVTLLAVAMPAPFFEPAAVWDRAYANLDAQIGMVQGPIVVAGDFNATLSHHAVRQLLTHGLTEANRDVGQGLDRTWPATGFLSFSGGLIRIDHVLVRGVVATAVDVGGSTGSDHRSLFVRLVIDGG